MKDAERVYQLISQIPPGRVMTYGQIARLTGIKNPRYIGWLLHHNPDQQTVPCHRVVNRVGRLAPAFAFGGPDQQAKLLTDEGVAVVNHHVDLNIFGCMSE